MRDIHTTLMGNATADPTPRQHDDGTVSASVRVAVTSRYYDSSTSGFADRKTEFITVFTRKALARNLLTSVKKGNPLVVTGRLGLSEWVADDGTSRHSLTLQAEALGHDLTFGAASFARPLKAEDVPEHDPQSGVILSRNEEEVTASPLTDEQSEDDEFAPAF